MAEGVDGQPDKYQWESLPDPGSFLRLLEFDSEAPVYNGRIDCRLANWAMQNAPSYHAVSYTWGDLAETETIRVYCKDLTVRKNCADVLRQLIHFQSCRYYFIDTICVNQDDMAEKSVQVAIMGDIFRQAKHVLACIGLQVEDDAEYALHAIHKIEDYFDVVGNIPRHRDPDCCRNGNIESKHRDPDWDGTGLPYGTYNKELGCAPGVDIARSISSLVALVERPYFTRVWVMQEFLLAQEVTVCCGYERLSLDILRWYLTHVTRTQSHLTYYTTMVIANPDEFIPDIVQIVQGLDTGSFSRFRLAITLLEVRSNRGEGLPGSCQQLSMTEIFAHCSRRQCEDPRDTVYAMLPLVRWNTACPILPDYNKTAFALAVEIAAGHGPHVLSRWLVSCLRLDEEENCDMLREVKLRRALMHQPNQWIEPTIFPSKQNMVKLRCRGFRLSEASHDIFYHHEPNLTYAELFDKADLTHPIAFLPSATRLGDWVVFVTDPAFCSDGEFVVRWTGSRFAIVGRAWLKLSARKADATVFWSFFDPTDAVVHIVIDSENKYSCPLRRWSDDRAPSWCLERLDVGICKYPLSSYVELRSG